MFTLGAADLDAWLAGFFFPFARVAALVATAPILSDAGMPRTIRAALAVVVTIIIAPTLAPTAVAPMSATGVALLVEEILIGTALGFAMQVAFAAVTMAGDMIGLQMGLSFATFVDPEHSEPAPLIGSFLTVLLMLYFLSFNGHLQMIAALADSFRSLPVGANLRMDDVHAILAAASSIFAIGLRLALPVIAAILVANLTLGMLMRTAPQVNLLAIGFPLTLALGFAVLALMLPSIAPTFDLVIAQGLRALRP
ncbi:MAG TPA: flagellar biosynthetic protein FliR [Casimicrobiaceae bacterium]|nr:flagellar biosynthetic protein FliR [Casimicrobiaceae bacterium]